MKDIMLKITGRTVTQNNGKEEQEDVIEFLTEGKFYGRGGDSALISYPESELSGLEGWTTYLAITGGKVKMKRSNGNGSPETIMEFEKGKRYEGQYETPFGPIGMEILTNSVSPLDMEPGGRGRLSIDYSVSLHGLMESRNKLDIEIVRSN
ncbi:MAG: DUF1934 domain-containing protein [Firmicutes bacterium]|nr:DUF1934 domain-containing protein [Bacillota bacterium]